MKLKISLCPLSVHEWEEPHESRHLITVSTRKRKTGFFVGKDLLKIDDDRPETHNAISTSEGATNIFKFCNKSGSLRYTQSATVIVGYTHSKYTWSLLTSRFPVCSEALGLCLSF